MQAIHRLRLEQYLADNLGVSDFDTYQHASAITELLGIGTLTCPDCECYLICPECDFQ